MSARPARQPNSAPAAPTPVPLLSNARRAPSAARGHPRQSRWTRRGAGKKPKPNQPCRASKAIRALPNEGLRPQLRQRQPELSSRLPHAAYPLLANIKSANPPTPAPLLMSFIHTRVPSRRRCLLTLLPSPSRRSSRQTPRPSGLAPPSERRRAPDPCTAVEGR